jgi:thiamine kinase-like enzyme
MNERYNFSQSRDQIEKVELNKNELDTISRLGLTFDDLEKIISGPEMAEGSYALIFELPVSNPTILAKVWKNPKDDAWRADHENVALRLLNLHKFKEAPHNMGYLKSETILFEEKIDGNLIDNFDKTAINQLAETMSKIHSIELNAYGKPLTKRKKGTQKDCLEDELEKLHIKLGFLSEENQLEILSLIKQAIEKIKKEVNDNSESFYASDFTLIHFDLNRNNILRSNDNSKIIIIDWEQASAGDSAMDIAKMFLKLNFNEEQKNDFLLEYEKNISKKDYYFEDRLDAYCPLVLVNSILWRIGVMKNIPEESSSTNEKEFYNRVKDNLDQETIQLKEFLKS